MSETIAVNSTTQNQAVTGLTTPATNDTKQADSSEFEASLKSFITPNGAENVSEEDLFAAIVKERLSALKGKESLTEFGKAFEETANEIKRADGVFSVEDATKGALKALRSSGVLTKEETDQIYSDAFEGAQLDSNKEALFDSRGGPNDPTRAVAALEQALLGARTVIEKILSGDTKAAVRSVDEASFGHTSNETSSASVTGAGGAGFLFKPVSDSDGKLAILLPPSLSGQIESVSLTDPSGSLIETGRYAGNGNGDRDHFRFSKPGGGYPSGLAVEVLLKGGEILKYTIDNPSERAENLTPSGESESKSDKDSSESTSSEVSSSVSSTTSSSSTETSKTESEKPKESSSSSQTKQDL